MIDRSIICFLFTVSKTRRQADPPIGQHSDHCSLQRLVCPRQHKDGNYSQAYSENLLPQFASLKQLFATPEEYRTQTIRDHQQWYCRPNPEEQHHQKRFCDPTGLRCQPNCRTQCRTYTRAPYSAKQCPGQELTTKPFCILPPGRRLRPRSQGRKNTRKPFLQRPYQKKHAHQQHEHCPGHTKHALIKSEHMPQSGEQGTDDRKRCGHSYRHRCGGQPVLLGGAAHNQGEDRQYAGR